MITTCLGPTPTYIFPGLSRELMDFANSVTEVLPYQIPNPQIEEIRLVSRRVLTSFQVADREWQIRLDDGGFEGGANKRTMGFCRVLRSLTTYYCWSWSKEALSRLAHGRGCHSDWTLSATHPPNSPDNEKATHQKIFAPLAIQTTWFYVQKLKCFINLTIHRSS